MRDGVSASSLYFGSTLLDTRGNYMILMLARHDTVQAGGQAK